MRLIDADALLSEVKKVCFSKEWLKFRFDYGSNGTRDHIISLIENAEGIIPFASVEYETIREYERPHGEWIENETQNAIVNGWCSYCGWQSKMHEEDILGAPFCPNCGAQMDGGAS